MVDNIKIFHKYLVTLAPNLIDEFKGADFLHPLFDFLFGVVILALYPPSSSTLHGNGKGGKDNRTVRLMISSGLTEFLIMEIVPLSPTTKNQSENGTAINTFLEHLSNQEYVKEYYAEMRGSLIKIQKEFEIALNLPHSQPTTYIAGPVAKNAASLIQMETVKCSSIELFRDEDKTLISQGPHISSSLTNGGRTSESMRSLFQIIYVIHNLPLLSNPDQIDVAISEMLEGAARDHFIQRGETVKWIDTRFGPTGLESARKKIQSIRHCNIACNKAVEALLSEISLSLRTL